MSVGLVASCERHIARAYRLNALSGAAPPIALKMSHKKIVPRRCAGGAAREQQRAAAALAAAPAPAPAPAPRHDAPSVVRAGASGGVVAGIKVELEKETLAQLRDRLGLSARLPAAGPRATFVHNAVEDSASGEDTGWGGEEGEEVEEQEGEGKAADEEEEEAEEEWEEEEWVGEDKEEVDGPQTGGGKRKRAEETAAAALPALLLQLTASALPPRVPHPPLDHVDVKREEGDGSGAGGPAGSPAAPCGGALPRPSPAAPAARTTLHRQRRDRRRFG